MDARAVSLNDRYELTEGRVFMNGLHALDPPADGADAAGSGQ